MVNWFLCLFVVVILQRLVELCIAKRNARFIERAGGYEVGGEHYRYIVALHVFFFLSLWAEVTWRGLPTHAFPSLLPFGAFLVAQGLRVWCLTSMGRFWNTRIYVLPGSDTVSKGPYRFLRHPNYVVVALELFTFPLCFGAVWTALLFTIANALVLRVRIRTEERALSEVTTYAESMGERPRFWPKSKKAAR